MRRVRQGFLRQDHTVLTSDGPLSFSLRKSYRRSISISVQLNGAVQVSAPFSFSEKKVFDLIHKKIEWITKKIAEFRLLKQKLTRVYDSDQEFLFLGEKWNLIVHEENIKRAKIDLIDRSWVVVVPKGLDPEKKQMCVKAKLFDWYRKKAQEIIVARVGHYAAKLNVEPSKIIVKTQKRMWGVCHHHSRKIYFNWQIVLSPLIVIDYVVIHELCHLIHANHSKRFWNKVQSIMPDYKIHQKWLKDNAGDVQLV